MSIECRAQNMRVRALGPDEIRVHKEVRLRALRDAPNSFGGTIDEDESLPETYWVAQTKAVTELGRNVMFMAVEDTQIHGMIYGLRDREKKDGARVGGMWVAPSARRQGLGRQLLMAVFDWARESGLRHIGLWVPAHASGAIGLYRDSGFRETGRRGHLRAGSELEISEMVREL